MAVRHRSNIATRRTTGRTTRRTTWRATRSAALGLAAAGALAAATVTTTTAAAEESFVVVKAGRVITVSGDEIERGEIVIVDGVIRLVGVGLEFPSDATVIDARDQTVMPGWVNPSSRHGLRGYGRNGVNADALVVDEVLLEEIDFEPMLEAGYTSVALRPDGGGMPGQAAVYRTAVPDELDPYGDAEQLLRRRSYVRIGFGNPGQDKNVVRGALRKAKAELEKIAKAREEWEKKRKEAEAKAAAAKKEGGEGDAKASGGDGGGDGKPAEGEAKPAEFSPPKTDRTHQPLMDWIDEKLALPPVFEVGGASAFVHLLDVMSQWEDLDFNMVLSPSDDNIHVVEDLAGWDGIVVTPMSLNRKPQTTTVVNWPAMFAAAGGNLALMPERSTGGFGGGFRGRGRGGGGGGGAVRAGDASADMRTVRSRLGLLVRAGLPRDEAIKAVTLHPAKVVGIDGRVGTIETGKDADLIFLDGDPVDPLSRVTQVMILGEIVWEHTP